MGFRKLFEFAFDFALIKPNFIYLVYSCNQSEKKCFFSKQEQSRETNLIMSTYLTFSLH